MAKTYRFGSGPRLINWLFRIMIRLGWGPSYQHLLTVRGRRTGKLYSTPVDVMELGGQRYLVAPYGVTNWVRNARASGEATLARRGRSEKFRVDEVDEKQAVPVLRQYLTQVPVTRSYFDAGPDSPDQAIAAGLPRHPVFRLIPVA